jgi:hypothetical protein
MINSPTFWSIVISVLLQKLEITQNSTHHMILEHLLYDLPKPIKYFKFKPIATEEIKLLSGISSYRFLALQVQHIIENRWIYCTELPFSYSIKLKASSAPSRRNTQIHFSEGAIEKHIWLTAELARKSIIWVNSIYSWLNPDHRFWILVRAVTTVKV